MKSISLACLAVALGLLAGCAGNPTAEHAIRSANRGLERDYAPLRMVATPTGKRSVAVSPQWAGTVAPSITTAASVVRDDVLQAFAAHCGFHAEQLAEVRVVWHRPPEFYEVWVFNDPQSGRKDGKSGVSVILRQLPNNGGVDYSLRGDCHSQPERVHHFM